MLYDHLLRFGPTVPEGAVNLAWIEIPELAPDENTALVACWRYLPGNQVGVDLTRITTSASGDQVLSLPLPAEASRTERGIPGVSVTGSGATHVLGRSVFPIQVLGPIEDPTGAWRLVIRDGCFWRHTVLTQTDLDSTWLGTARTSGGAAAFAAGDDVWLLYSVPEASIQPWENAANHSLTYTGPARVLGEHEVQLLADADGRCRLLTLSSLTVNGVEVLEAPLVYDLDGTAVSGTPASGITQLDPARGLVTLARSLGEEDEVVATSEYVQDYLLYQGYFQPSGAATVFRELDLNPARGHRFVDRSGPRESRDLLESLVKVYALPTAAYKTPTATGAVRRDFYSLIAAAGSGLVQSIVWEWAELGASASGALLGQSAWNTFGYGRYGRAHYATTQSREPDLQDSEWGSVPCAVKLAEVYLGPNALKSSVRVLDTRSRGGGLRATLEIPDLPPALQAEAGTYLDLSGWDGPAIMTDGVVVVDVPKAVLEPGNSPKQFTKEEVEAAVRKHLAAGIHPIIRYL